jgi:hypothetical protein
MTFCCAVLVTFAAQSLLAQTPASAPAKARATPAARLVTVIPQVSVEAMPLMRVFNLYGELSGLAIEPDWAALKAVGVTKETPVTLKVKGVTFDKILDLTVNQAAQKDAPLAWYLSGETVIVSTQGRVLLRDRVAALALAVEKPDRREPGTAGAPAVAVAGAAKEKRPVTAKEFNFDNTALKLVLQFIFDLADVNYHVNWKALEASGIAADTPITVKAKDITPGRALDLVIDQLNVAKDRLSSAYWVVDEGVVEVSTGDALNQKFRTRVFDITDLLLVVPQFIAPQIDITAQGNSAATGNTSGTPGGATNLFANSTSGGGAKSASDEVDHAQAKQKLCDSIVDIVKKSIGEDMWAPTGKGSVTVFQNKLVISQSLLGFKLLEECTGR